MLWYDMTPTQRNQAVATLLGHEEWSMEHKYPRPYIDSMTSAWLVVDHLFKLDYSYILERRPTGTYAAFRHVDTPRQRYGGAYVEGMPDDASAPDATCQAAIDALGILDTKGIYHAL